MFRMFLSRKISSTFHQDLSIGHLYIFVIRLFVLRLSHAANSGYESQHEQLPEQTGESGTLYQPID